MILGAATKARSTTLALLVLLVSVSCERELPESADRYETSAPQAQDEIDQLRALGYLDFTDEIVDPAEKSVPILDPVRSYPGFNLFVSRSLGLAQLIDSRGKVLRSWTHQPSTAWSNAELTEGRDLLVQGSNEERNFLLRLSWDGSVIWKRMMDAHHDVEVTPDGLLATLTFRYRRIPEIDEKWDVRDHQIALLTQEGRPVKEYSLYEMMNAAPDLFTFQRVAAVGGFVDLLHSNSVEFMRHPHLEARHPIYARSNAIVAIRHQDTIAIFDLDARKLVWAWGQGQILGPHDATVLENGNVLLFDNGLGRGWSRVIELDPLEKEMVWQYRAPVPGDFYSAGRGSNQRLPNGNTLVANSDAGEAFEVTREGEVVWKFRNPNTNSSGQRATIVRIKRYSGEFIGAR